MPRRSTSPRPISRRFTAPQRFVAAIGLMTLALIVAGCAPTAEIRDPGPLPGPGGLRHFGFAAVECGLDDPNDDTTTTSYAHEVRGFTNVAHLCVFDPEQDLAGGFDRLRQAGLRAMLHIEPLFFTQVPDAALPRGSRTVRIADWQDRWRKFLTRHSALLTPDRIAFLLLADEPTWAGLPSVELAEVATTVESDLPAVDSMVIESYLGLDRFDVPTTVDWVGFDRYGIADPLHNKEYRANLTQLRSRMSRPGQRIAIIADTQWIPDYEALGIRPDDMAAVARSFYHLAATEPDVGALLGYTWPGGIDGTGHRGARDLPDVVTQALREIGAKVLGAAATPNAPMPA